MTDEQKLSTFMKRHGVRKEVARRYLSANNWSLETATCTFESEAAAKKEESERPSESSPAEGSNRDLQSLLSEHSRRRDADQDGYQAGGSNSSGSEHEPPVGKRVNIENSTPAITNHDSDRSLRVWGHGVRLGSAHPINPPPMSAAEDSDAEPADEEHTMVVLHLWSEGFSLDDGSLRPYAVPENERFLRAVLSGDFPEEMLRVPGVQLSVQDHTNEPFRHLSRKQFMGPGRPLNSPPSRILVAGPIPLEPQTIQLNEHVAITTVQLRLADGSRVSGRFNLTHNIGDLYRYARLARPEFSTRNFVLLTAFPRQELLESDTRTLVQANLCNVVVIQHLSDEQSEPLSSDSEPIVK
ncbi:UBX domain-containing protein 2B [Drosophila ficusphila]|uniref:UBX domain-containing protein 2B n=1 Tax=Drosophila ficusphila TaxID=30025 RepID=UPI0007E7855F|nr:UBX domain-containing protein 2B [Drosophila ficusphila]